MYRFLKQPFVHFRILNLKDKLPNKGTKFKFQITKVKFPMIQRQFFGINFKIEVAMCDFHFKI